MVKAELVIKVSRKENIPANSAKTIVDLFFEAMKEALERGERVEVRGFGCFGVRSYKRYTGRNPKTGGDCWRSSEEACFFQGG